MPPPEPPVVPLSLFYSYSHMDEKLREKLDIHLSLLKRQGVISGWHDRRIEAGTEWKGQIDQHLDAANIILLLVSADFLASDYCYDIEMKRALERHDRGEAQVIPVILRPCDWHTAPFGKLQALPKDSRPVAKWANRDDAFTDIARGIREAVKDLTTGSQTPSSPAPPVPVVTTTPAAQTRSIDNIYIPYLIHLRGDPSGDPIADVVFVHGLDGDARTTWIAPDGQFWPDWLADDISGPVYWSLSYSVPSSEWSGPSLPLVDHALAALDYLVASGLGKRPACFIAHSLGGLLVKQMLRTASEFEKRFRPIARCVRGIVFLATPHAGSRVSNLVRILSLVYRPTPAVRDLEHQDPHLRDLNHWYKFNCVELGVRNQVYFETRPTSGVRVVDAFSADGGFPDCTPIPVEADHIQICKPANRGAPVYVGVKHFLENLLNSMAPRAIPDGVAAIRRQLLEVPGVFDLRRLLQRANQLVAADRLNPESLSVRDAITEALSREALRGSREEGESLVRFLAHTAPVRPETARDLANALGSRLYLTILGTIELDPGVPSAIFATRVSGRVDLAWRASLDDFTSSPAATLFSFDAVDGPADTVTFRDGLIQVRAGQLPADGRWRAFCLADGTDLSTSLAKEPFLLLRAPDDPFSRPGESAEVNPFVMVDHGYLLEAWMTALDEGWGRQPLAGLLMTLFAKMRELIEKALTEAGDRASAWPRPVTKRLEKILQDTVPVWQQSCAEMFTRCD